MASRSIKQENSGAMTQELTVHKDVEWRLLLLCAINSSVIQLQYFHLMMSDRPRPLTTECTHLECYGIT
ncbi:hypothetical protein J6590_030499 [Homalodisca vitripennis]|nr:hypothetical protein J6590_104816 [Homalodisca vitripennis]KAG8282777.1 hypothetical protein J6590_030499 [Homalodisca vitripennis]